MAWARDVVSQASYVCGCQWPQTYNKHGRRSRNRVIVIDRRLQAIYNAPRTVDSDLMGAGLTAFFLESQRTGSTPQRVLPVKPSAFGWQLEVRDPEYRTAIQGILSPRSG